MAVPPLILAGSLILSVHLLARAAISGKVLILSAVCVQVSRRGLLQRSTQFTCSLEGKIARIITRVPLRWLKAGEPLLVIINASSPVTETGDGFLMTQIYGTLPEKI